MKNFLFALRYLRKLRGGTLARVVSLSLGLAVGLLVFSYANYNLTSDRCFPDRERIFQLWAHYADPQHSGYSPQLNAPIAPALAEEVPQVEAATRLFGPRTSDIVRGDNAFQAKYIYADTMFFDVLGFEPMNGNPKEILLHADQVMLAESFSRTIFGRKDPVGQLVLLNGTDSLTVMGLFRDPNPNQHLGGFNMLCSFEIVKRDLNTSWRGGDSFPSYVKLHKGVSVAEVEAQLPAFFDRHGFTEDMKAWNRSYRFFPITESSRINTSAGLIAWVLMALAALTLFVASMNYVLISISTLVSRSKTIAMLKVGGARPSDIFRIFCSETAILTFASVIVAGFLLWALQDQVLEITGTPMSELFALKRIWVPLLVILAAFALAALIPSRIFTSVPVTLAFREVPLWGYSGMPCIDENSKELLFSCRWLLCNEGFIPAMRMHLVGGRNFTPSSNPLEAIVNETYVRMRGWTPEQALGHQITDDSSPGAPLYTIVGVVKDFRTVVATGEVEPIVFHPFSYFQKFGATDDYMLDYSMMIRLRGMSPESLEAVQRKIGEYPSGNNHTLEVYDNKLGPILFEIRSFRNIVFTVSGITLLIALMGLVGYLGDEMRRRSKEIALRKVNGASTADVLRLLARDVLWIAVPSVVVGAAVSRWGADLLVSNFVERVALRWWLFALCGAVVLLIVCAVQLVRTWRIANANPINMIKTE